MKTFEILIEYRGDKYKVQATELSYAEYRQLLLNLGENPQMLSVHVIEAMIRRVMKYDKNASEWKEIDKLALPAVVMDEIFTELNEYLLKQKQELKVTIQEIDVNPF